MAKIIIDNTDGDAAIRVSENMRAPTVLAIGEKAEFEVNFHNILTVAEVDAEPPVPGV